MPADAIYFPTINVPNSSWFSRTLLYWDSIATIVPNEYFVNPEALDRHSLELVREGLVKPLAPLMHTWEIQNFSAPFIDYLGNLGAELRRREKGFSKSSGIEINFEKLNHAIVKGLRKMELAEVASRGWLLVEATTANDFMAYLAATLGQLPSVNMTPITNLRKHLSPLIGDSERIYGELDVMRLELLSEAFPAPRRHVRAQDIADFKRLHGDKLYSYRHYIETELTGLVAISDRAVRQYRMDQVKAYITKEIRVLLDAMESYGWIDIVLGKLCALLGPIPGVGTLPSMLNAVYQACGGDQSHIGSPLVYAAYAHKSLTLGGN